MAKEAAKDTNKKQAKEKGKEKTKLSFRSLGAKKLVSADKVTMNFARHKSDFNLATVLLWAAFCGVLVLAFVYYGILGPMDRKMEALNELGKTQDELSAYNARLSEWDELEALYGRYSYGWMTEVETSLVERMDIISLMEKHIVPRATVQDFAISGNVMTVNLAGLSLDETSSLVTLLESQPLVKSVMVYSASNKDDDVKRVNMVIILEKVKEAA